MKLGDMEFWRDEDGDWIEDPILYVDTLLDYIESHGLDKADEKIAELSKLCNDKDAEILRHLKEKTELRQLYCKAVNVPQTMTEEPSYKQRFIDEAAIAIRASNPNQSFLWAWKCAVKLWDTRITD